MSELIAVVRCKDCEYLENAYIGSYKVGYCDLGECIRFGCKPNDYCNYGKLKENNVSKDKVKDKVIELIQKQSSPKVFDYMHLISILGNLTDFNIR